VPEKLVERFVGEARMRMLKMLGTQFAELAAISDAVVLLLELGFEVAVKVLILTALLTHGFDVSKHLLDPAIHHR